KSWRCRDVGFFLGLSPKTVRRLVHDGQLRGEIRSTRTRAPGMACAYRRDKLCISHAELWRDAGQNWGHGDTPMEIWRLAMLRRVCPAPWWVSSASAATLLDVSPRYVRMLYRAGRLAGQIRTSRFRAPGWPHAYQRRRLMIFMPSIFTYALDIP